MDASHRHTTSKTPNRFIIKLNKIDNIHMYVRDAKFVKIVHFQYHSNQCFSWHNLQISFINFDAFKTTILENVEINSNSKFQQLYDRFFKQVLIHFCIYFKRKSLYLES